MSRPLVNVALGLGVVATLAVVMWRDGTRLAAVASRRAPTSRAIVEVPTPTGDVDRCPTCHGIERGAHPVVPGHARLETFGCTPCHGGSGRRLDASAHGPALGAGLDPFLRPPYSQALCARCHIPTAAFGTSALDQGIREYLAGGCTGCHQPGRVDEGLGPDLRRLGRRTLAELEGALLSPREEHAGATMWSLRWRFDPASPSGKTRLAALITALLAFGQDPGPYRAQWAKRDIAVDLSTCQSCHGEQQTARDRIPGPAHRCTLLKERASLRCSRCHDRDKGTQLPPVAQRTGRPCPTLQNARGLCTVCHLRGDDGADRAPRITSGN